MTDGGPAFPNGPEDGMTLRAYMATKFLAAHIAKNGLIEVPAGPSAKQLFDETLQWDVSRALDYADALIKELS